MGAGETLTQNALRIDERILHYLTGVSYLDVLEGLVHRVEAPPDLPPTLQESANRITALCSAGTSGASAAIQLTGNASVEAVRVAAAASAQLGLRLHTLSAADIPAGADRELLARLWDRGVCAQPRRPADRMGGAGPAPRRRRVRRNHSRNHVHCRTRSADAQAAPGLAGGSGAPGHIRAERDLGARAGPGSARQWSVEPGRRAFPSGSSKHRSRRSRRAYGGPGDLAAKLWDACRMQARTRLEGLAQRMEGGPG